jgi:energy-converting hydrogenase Eha subunit E
MKSTPIVAGLLYEVIGKGVCLIVAADNASAAIVTAISIVLNRHYKEQ